MGERDEMAADTLADREPVTCPGCCGHGYYQDDDRYYRCEECGGTGRWGT